MSQYNQKLRIHLHDLSGDETPLQIATNNLQVADKTSDIALVSMAMVGYMRAMEEEKKVIPTIQDIEKYFRSLNLDTYLIASAKPLPDIYELRPYSIFLKDKRGDVLSKYTLVFSCRPPPYALRELFEHHDSYENNFAVLNEAGCIVMKVSDDDDGIEIPHGIYEKISNLGGLLKCTIVG